MKTDNHKNKFVADTFKVKDKKKNTKVAKQNKKKTGNTQLRLKKK